MSYVELTYTSSEFPMVVAREVSFRHADCMVVVIVDVIIEDDIADPVFFRYYLISSGKISIYFFHIL
jgi:hypothetical protein